MGNVRELVMKEPDGCEACGWEKPQVDPKNNGEPVLPEEDRWIFITIPNCAIWLYCCPRCGTARANKNAIENMKKVTEAQKSRIVMPNAPGSGLVH